MDTRKSVETCEEYVWQITKQIKSKLRVLETGVLRRARGISMYRMDSLRNVRIRKTMSINGDIVEEADRTPPERRKEET